MLRLPTGRIPLAKALLVALPLVAAIGVIDYETGPFAMALLYYVPIVTVAWLSGPFAAVIVAAGAFVSLLTCEFLLTPSLTAVIYWNSFTRLVTFEALGLMVALVRRDRDEVHSLNERLNLTLESETRLARTDALTGLPNSRAFREALVRELARCQREQAPLAIGYVDLDNFKRINDTWGHGTGDEVLRRVGDALRESTRAEDIPARVGGDEFAIVVVRPEEGSLDSIARRIREKLSEIANGYPYVGFGATIGFVHYANPPLDPDAIVGEADAAMYEVKVRAKGSYRIINR